MPLLEKKRRDKKVIFMFNIDFGTGRGNSVETHYTTNISAQKGLVKAIFCRNITNTSLSSDVKFIQVMKGGNAIHKTLAGIQRYCYSEFPSQEWSQYFFDIFAVKKLPKEPYILFLTDPLRKTVTKALRHGYQIAYVCGNHPDYIKHVIKHEQNKWGVNVFSGASEGILTKLKATINDSSIIIVPSLHCKHSLIRQGIKKKIYVNPLGINLKKYSSKVLRKERDLIIRYLFVGDMTLLKGVQYLLEAWRRFPFTDSKLILCGKISPDMRRLVTRYKTVTNNVEFLGHVADPYSNCTDRTVFVSPSLNESFGMAPLEAMAIGIPPIVTTEFGVSIRNKYNGLIVECGQTKKLLEAMLYFYHNLSEIQRIGLNAKKTAQEYTYRKYSIRTARILTEIQAGR